MAAPPSSHPFLNPYGQPMGFRVTEESSPQAESVVTLMIKHLPDAIPHETLTRLFSHYGASSVRPCTSGRLRNCAFVDFNNETVAHQAQRQLNGLRFLGKILLVERANKAPVDGKQAQLGKDSALSMKDASKSRDLNELPKSGQIHYNEPIAPRLGVDYPFPPHLEYAYPPPDSNILTNIVNALIAVPRFYTQVLHLMNKMNIPAPFRMALPTPPLPPPVPAPSPSLPRPPTSVPKPPANLSSDESELESSDEDASSRAHPTGASSIAKSGRKRIRHEDIVGPGIDKEVAHEAVGVKPATLVPKEIPLIKKRNPMMQIKIASKMNLDEHKDDNSIKELEELKQEESGHKHFATPEEIERLKLPPEEILSLPMFKNYTAGNPASVLYIKNLAKDVTPDDFYFIFGSLFGSIEAAKFGLSIKLMQEGRMKGQAFVTFPSIELAHNALNLASGYVFKGKPIIIQFGRNPAASKGS